MIIAGNKIYTVCGVCSKLVKVNGLFGGLHFCEAVCPTQRRPTPSEHRVLRKLAPSRQLEKEL